MPEAGLKPLYTSSEIADRLQQLAGDISAEMSPGFVMVAILTGSFVFAADLIRALAARGASPAVDFMILSSYGGATRSSGTVRLLRDTALDISGRDVLVVDDILDSGRTLAFARDHLLARGAASVRICVLLDKGSQVGQEHCHAEFVGFSCPDAFVVGYGMDHDHKFRGLPHIAVLCQ
jgi:hypoxanthine phosphoribosyltransferase